MPAADVSGNGGSKGKGRGKGNQPLSPFAPAPAAPSSGWPAPTGSGVVRSTSTLDLLTGGPSGGGYPEHEDPVVAELMIGRRDSVDTGPPAPAYGAIDGSFDYARPPDEVVKAEAAQARLERQHALDIDAESLLTRKQVNRATDRMTWAEYNALSPAERAAVDFNGLLVRAVRKDARNQDVYEKTASPEEKATYKATVEQLFGPDRGSETYAPETVAVLSQLDFADKNADLDDFLSLRTAVTADDLKLIDTGGAPLNEAGQDRLELQQGLAESTSALRETLARGSMMLQNFKTTALAERSQHVTLLGGDPSEVHAALGFGTSDTDKYFQQAFDLLADKANADKFEGILRHTGEDLRGWGIDPKAFYRYLDVRTRNAREYDLDLGVGADRHYHSAEELRDLLDLGGR